MTRKRQILVTVAVLLAPSLLLAAEEPVSARLQEPGQAEVGALFPTRVPGSLDDSPYLTRGQSALHQDAAVRFGWWAVDTDGAVNKTFEFADPESAPFWDVDSITSDGQKTADFSLTGNDLESTQARFYYFGPSVSADVDFQRYIRQLDHNPLNNMLDFGDLQAGDTRKILREDLDINGEYAIRVQQLDARFKGYLTENVKWRLNLWGMRKQGERQAKTYGHCYQDARIPVQGDISTPGGGVGCHVLSQRQTINWLTMEIEPVVETRVGPVTVEYSRLMRSFNQDDQVVTRPFNFALPPDASSESAGWMFGTQPYGIVPENFTQIDRVKVGADVTENTDFYANLFVGDTENKSQRTHRSFGGFDLRLNNRSIDGLSLTGYVKRIEEKNQDAPGALDPRPDAKHDGLPLDPDNAPPWTPPNRFDDEGRNNIHANIDYTRTTAGVKGRWTPFQLRSRDIAFTGGYEYREIERDNANFVVGRLNNVSGIDALFAEPLTPSHWLHVGTQIRWSRNLNAFVRYKMGFVEDPLFGIRNKSRATIAEATNTRLPEHEDIIKIGGSWLPTNELLFAGNFGIEKRHNSSAFARFDEDDYPIELSADYSPSDRLSITGGLAFHTNWINQDITLGERAGANGAFRAPWSYGGKTQLVNVGGNYAYNECLTFLGGLEWVRSENRIATPPSPASYVDSRDSVTVTPDYSDMPGFFDVLVQTTRLTAGVDYLLRDGISCYFRYIYFDYEDESEDFNSGVAHMFLGGISAVY